VFFFKIGILSIETENRYEDKTLKSISNTKLHHKQQMTGIVANGRRGFYFAFFDFKKCF